MTALMKYSDYAALSGSVLRGDETLLIADTASNGTVTASTISATASTNTIADSGFGLPIVKVGAFVSISGFTDTAEELNGLHIVVSSTSSALVVTTDLTTNEAAGQSVTVSEVAAMYQVALSALTSFSSGSTESNIQPNTQTGTAYTLTLADYTGGKIVEMDNAAANSVIIPADTFPVGAVIPFRQIGVGVTTAVGGSGVTVTPPSGNVASIGAQNGSATLHQRALNVWIVEGHLAASA